MSRNATDADVTRISQRTGFQSTIVRAVIKMSKSYRITLKGFLSQKRQEYQLIAHNWEFKQVLKGRRWAEERLGTQKSSDALNKLKAVLGPLYDTAEPLVQLLLESSESQPIKAAYSDALALSRRNSYNEREQARAAELTESTHNKLVSKILQFEKYIDLIDEIEKL